ncbi:MAG: hypothetical protein JKY34_02615, partial [Kordiimonadaceae bacterium]|nr:hypothetical protein [Kordiimonadaceae bacterium]
CNKCGNQTCWWHEKEQAITAWNSRPIETELLEVLDTLWREASQSNLVTHADGKDALMAATYVMMKARGEV